MPDGYYNGAQASLRLSGENRVRLKIHSIRPRLLTASLFAAAALLGAACAPAPEVIVLAPTETPVGPVVPTRAPTSSPAPADTSPTAPVAPATETPGATLTTAPATSEPTQTETAPLPTSTTPPTAATPATVTNTPTATTQPSATAEPSATPSPTSPPPTPTEAAPVDTVQAALAAATPVALGDAVSGVIDNNTPVAVYGLDASAGEVLDLKVDASSGNLRPVLHVLDAEGGELARSLIIPGGQQALLRGVELSAGGPYYVIVSRLDGEFGFTTGQFELILGAGTSGGQSGVFAHHVEYDTLHTGTIDSAAPQLIFTFTGAAGDLVSIQTTATSGDLDSRLELSDTLGNLLALNDDDPLTRTLDAGIYRFVLPAGGSYSITAGRFLGAESSGEFRLKLTLEGNAGPNAPLQAPLIVANSASIRDDGTFIVDFRAGDHWVGDGVEARVQSLLTFELPSVPDGAAPTARLVLNACTEFGSVFDTLGSLRVFEDRFGQLNVPRDYTRALAGARILADVSSCDPIDVSGAVAAAYADGRKVIQFRLTFAATNNNRQTDEIRFDPRLEISAGA